jgi:hypothetical protein
MSGMGKVKAELLYIIISEMEFDFLQVYLKTL